MRDTIRFLLGDTPRTLDGVSPTTTVLDYLRTRENLVGTKEGCAEGDCGACTVVLAEPSATGLRHRAVNACILFVPALDGRQLLTVEHLRQPDGTLHPVQQAMVRHHASQCGFCTPGFVMSLFAMQQTDPAPDRQAVNEALAGNLCRCTGYRPIADAAQDLGPLDPRTAAATAARLCELDVAETLVLEQDGQRSISPQSADELAAVLLAHPDAVMVAGGTDVGLWVTKQHRRLPTVVTLDSVADLARIMTDGETIRLGAGVRYEDALGVLEEHWPDLGALIRRIGSRQIRNRGTIGGNIANGSPIGDMPPALIALGASLVLRRGVQRRSLPLEDFFTGYRRTALLAGEFIEWVEVPRPAPDAVFRTYKVSKRFDQDISAVCLGFGLTLRDGVVHDIRLAYGGMAATPVRARRTEQALIGLPWTEATVRAAMTHLAADFRPISDMRASAAYRATVAGNLLFRGFLETAAPPQRTRVAVPA
jgi:xanthine dehydrogenase small subunit